MNQMNHQQMPMARGAVWISNHLFLGRTVIGRIEPRAREDPKHVMALSYLPGAQIGIGFYLNEHEARLKVERSANSRMKAMLFASIEDISRTTETGRDLRKVARAIYRAGVWTCDRPTYAQAMFRDLGKALEMTPADEPTPLEGVSYDQECGQCSAFEVPDDEALIA